MIGNILCCDKHVKRGMGGAELVRMLEAIFSGAKNSHKRGKWGGGGVKVSGVTNTSHKGESWGL